MAIRSFPLLLLTLLACNGPHPPAGWESFADGGWFADAAIASHADARNFVDGGACGTDWVCTNPVADGCMPGGGDACDGVDNDCDGEVDEGCVCTPGRVQACFAGPPGRRNVGACVDGQQTCVGSGEFTHWGPCVGGITPGAETCDGQDNSCTGCVDDRPDCCTAALNCPSSTAFPPGQPFSEYTIDGGSFFAGTVSSWSWTVVGGPCDRLLDATTGSVSYTIFGAATSRLTLLPTLSGDYTITAEMGTAAGIRQCSFVVHVGGPGLRFELCWDTTGPVDLDLHVHKEAHPSGDNSPWFTSDGSTDINNINPDDCYYQNCNASAYVAGNGTANWGPDYGNSPLSKCGGGPLGPAWQQHGSCPNPRLDLDNVSTPGLPENVSIDVPRNNKTYRAMVHYYNGTQTTRPMLNVYCGGKLEATYGAAPDLVSGFNQGQGFGRGTMWRVVDVTTQVIGGKTAGCTLTALSPPDMPGDYWVTNDDMSY